MYTLKYGDLRDYQNLNYKLCILFIDSVYMGDNGGGGESAMYSKAF